MALNTNFAFSTIYKKLNLNLIIAMWSKIDIAQFLLQKIEYSKTSCKELQG